MNTNTFIKSLLSVKFITALLIILLSGNSCTDKFNEYNTNKTQLMEIGPKQLAALFSSAQFYGACWLTTDHYTRIMATHINHLCGYVVASDISQEQNFLNLSNLNAAISRHFSRTIPSINSVLDITKTNNRPAYDIAQIYKVYIMHQLTDLMGPIPYSKAGSGEEKIPYESQKDVYYKMFDDLNSSLTSLTSLVQNSPGLNVFGAGDMIYNGDASKWIKFGNTLRLRLAIRISNIDPNKARVEAEAAAAGRTLETSADDALCSVTQWTSQGNGMPRADGFFNNAMSQTMESFMVGYNDPRISEYWSPVVIDGSMNAPGYLQEFKNNVGGYHGFTRGYSSSELTYFKAHSKLGPRFKDGKQLITPINIMNASEAYFLKAEGAWKGWNMGGTAQSFYEKGIEISIKQWKGNSYSATEISNYINNTAKPIAPNNYPVYDAPTTDIPVKFSTAKDKQYEQILTQKWIALFPISTEAFAEYRRTLLPKLHAKKNSVDANVNPALGQIVRRFPFIINEVTTQPEEIAKAVVLLGGPDTNATPLWWDVNPK